MKGDEEKMLPQPEMAESSIAAVNSKAETSIPNDRSLSPSSSKTKTNTSAIKGKSCKGCLYYSSVIQANSRNPLCVGLSRSLPEVPRYIPEDSKIHTYEEGKRLADFRYGCLGYSLYKDRKGQTSDGQQIPTELPVCVGLEILVDRRAKVHDSESVPSHIHIKEDGKRLPQPRSPKPTNANGDEFLSRFARNANLVANGVAKNMRKVGNQIKQTLDDLLLPYRRRPK